VKYKVIFRPEARDEVLAAADYIASHGSDHAALRWYEGLEDSIAILSTFPAGYAYAREHGMLPGVELRQMVYKSHRLIFTIRGNEVHVLHVRHAAQANMQRIDDVE